MSNLKTSDLKKIGQLAENRACQYLDQQGLKLVCRNYRCRLGEIDLIMKDHDTLVFIEVRLRCPSRFARAAESIDRVKQQKIIKTAQYYLQQEKLDSTISCRFDVVAIDGHQLQWIKRAFELT